MKLSTRAVQTGSLAQWDALVLSRRVAHCRHGGARWQRVSFCRSLDWSASHKLSSELDAAALLHVFGRCALTVVWESSGSRWVLFAYVTGWVHLESCALTDYSPVADCRDIWIITRHIFHRTPWRFASSHLHNQEEYCGTLFGKWLVMIFPLLD